MPPSLTFPSAFPLGQLASDPRGGYPAYAAHIRHYRYHRLMKYGRESADGPSGNTAHPAMGRVVEILRAAQV